MQCPKCGNAADEQASYCEVCYEVLRKTPSSPTVRMASPGGAAGGPTVRVSSLCGWSHKSTIAALGLFAIIVPLRERIMNALWMLDYVNLAFHEGGHIVFGVLGNRFIMVCGGTAMQLILPAAAAWEFYRRGERASTSAAVWWFGQNFLGIGRYVADARAQQLDLLAGGVHDWTYLLETVGLLTHDEGLGRAVQIFGCLIMAFAAVGIYSFRASRAFGEQTT